MKLTINKKILKIIIAIIVAVLLIVASIFIIKAISVNIQIKETKERLSQINAEELKEKLIEELKKTDFNVNMNTDTMSVTTEFTDTFGENQLKDFTEILITAHKYNKLVAGIEIPCFKITSDDNGNFKNIEYIDGTILDSWIIENTIQKVFKDSYNIDLTIIGNAKYNLTFNKSKTNSGNISFASNEFLVTIISRINNTNLDYSEIKKEALMETLLNKYTHYDTAKFGLDLDEISNPDNSNNSNNESTGQILTQEQKNKLILAALQDRLNEKVNKGDILNMHIKEYDNYDRFLVYSYVTSTQDTSNPDSMLKSTLSNSEYGYMYYLTKNIYKNRIYVGVISLKSENGQYNFDLSNPHSAVSYDYETFVNAQNGSDATSEKAYLNYAEQEVEKTFNVAKNKVNWNQPQNSTSTKENITDKTESNISSNSNNTTSNKQNQVKNGTYNKRLTDEEKDMGVIELRRYLFRNN